MNLITSPSLLKLLNAARVQKIIRVDDHRTSGFTGNMLARYCHHNVAYLTRKYGGKHVSGFTITKLSGGYLGLHHSIWKTQKVDMSKSLVKIPQPPKTILQSLAK